jgi:hypothetical protein
LCCGYRPYTCGRKRSQFRGCDIGVQDPLSKACYGAVLIARATVVHSGKTQAVCRCDVSVVGEGKENLCAVSQGTIAEISQSSEAQA